MRLGTVLALALLPLAGAACLKSECSQSNVWGVQIAVRDQGGNAQADSALAVLTDGFYKDTMKITQFDLNTGVPLVLSGAKDRAGLYDLCLRKPGFADYQQNNIIVAATTCGIAPQQFQVILALPNSTSTVC